MRLLTVAVLSVATLSGSEAAIAFNCSGITLPSSIVICSDPDLTRLADERQQIFNETRSRLTPEQQPSAVGRIQYTGSREHDCRERHHW
jgi:uncharacterized protein